MNDVFKSLEELESRDVSISVFKTSAQTLIYVRKISAGEVTHYAVDSHFDLYLKIRKETPHLVIISSTKRELVASLKSMNYYI